MKPTDVLQIVLVFALSTSVWGQAGRALSGDAFASPSVTVGPGDYAQEDNPPCYTKQMGDDMAGIAAALATRTFAASYPALKLIAPTVGHAVYTIVEQSRDWLRQQGGDIAKYIAPERFASCQTVAVPIPQACALVSFRFYASDDELSGSCNEIDGGWNKCDVGWAAWSRTVENGYAVATFKNWSGDRTRNARVDISCAQWR